MSVRSNWENKTMGDKPETPKVPHYYMTMHYGICHGPIDSINQLFIKEKQVFCGNVVDDALVAVDLPELFGGDTKEGGPEGVIECYMGSDDQVLSNTVASRFNLTSEEIPGYRNLANIFLRGFEEDERESFIETNSLTNYFYAGSGGILALSIVINKLFNFFGVPLPKLGGFKFGVNNPYVPSAWANVTRLGQSGLVEANKAIYTSVTLTGEMIDYQVGNSFAVGSSSNPGETLFSLAGYAEEIDAGTATMSTRTVMEYLYSSIFSLPALYGEVQIRPLDADMNVIDTLEATGEVNWNVSGFSQIDNYFGTELEQPGLLEPRYRQYATGRWNFPLKKIPIGTRFLRVESFIITQTAVRLEPPHPRKTEVWITTQDKDIGLPLCTYDGVVGPPPDMNPAHILLEVGTNQDWGGGDPVEAYDVQSYEDLATLMSAENFGLSMLWNRQGTIKAFEQEVLDHIQAVKYVEPSNGLWTVKAIRGDYDPATLDILDPSNCEATNRQRLALSETVNEIIVEWTNYQNEETETVSIQDPANIAQQGGQVVSRTRSYYGVRNSKLAMRLARRDIRAESYPAFSVDIVADRRFSYLRPGSVVKFSWPEDGIQEMVLRVQTVDYGRPGQGEIKIKAVEDTFAFGTAEVVEPSPSLWASEDVPIAPLDTTAILTTPVALLLQSGFSLSELSDSDYPKSIPMVLGYAPQVEYISLYGSTVASDGSSSSAVYGSVESSRYALTEKELLAEPHSTVSGAFVKTMLGLNDYASGDIFMLGTTDLSSEFVMLNGYDKSTDTWDLARGIYDTVPQRWAVGTPIWYLGDELYVLDKRTQDALVETEYTLLPKFPQGSLPIIEATAIPFTPTERSYAPTRPANVSISPLVSTDALTHSAFLVNGDGASAIGAEWTVTGAPVAASVAVPVVLTDGSSVDIVPYVSNNYFYAATDASMSQRVSVPRAFKGVVDAGGQSLQINWRQAAQEAVSGTFRLDFSFYDATDTLISATTGSEEVGALGKWSPRSAIAEIPVGTRSVEIAAVWTIGAAAYGAYVDDLAQKWGDGLVSVANIAVGYGTTALTVSWSNRNRTTEDVVANLWTEASVTGEVGQVCRVRAYNAESDVLVFESPDVPTDTYELQIADISAADVVDVEVVALRDGFESIQNARVRVYLNTGGWGLTYGLNYGSSG